MSSPNVLTLTKSHNKLIQNIREIYNHAASLRPFSEQNLYLLEQMRIASNAQNPEALKIAARAADCLSSKLGTDEARELSDFGKTLLDPNKA